MHDAACSFTITYVRISAHCPQTVSFLCLWSPVKMGCFFCVFSRPLAVVVWSFALTPNVRSPNNPFFTPFPASNLTQLIAIQTATAQNFASVRTGIKPNFNPHTLNGNNAAGIDAATPQRTKRLPALDRQSDLGSYCRAGAGPFWTAE